MVKKVISKEPKQKRVDTNIKINLEQEINFLSCKEIVFCKETQTETQTDIMLKCNECNFEGTSEKDIGWHMGKNHGWPDDQKSEEMDISEDRPRNCDKCSYEAEDLYDFDAHRWSEHISYSEDSPDSIVCSFCDQIFERKGELMRHKKNEHEENVKTCWKFTAGNCTFEDDKCWFMHNREIKSTEYKCQLCEKVFATLPDFMQHRKRFHEQIVQECKNETKGSCIYGKRNCWFRHKENESTKEINETINKHNEDDSKENNEVIERMMKMMETLTKRIVQMEMKTISRNNHK